MVNMFGHESWTKKNINLIKKKLKEEKQKQEMVCDLK